MAIDPRSPEGHDILRRAEAARTSLVQSGLMRLSVAFLMYVQRVRSDKEKEGNSTVAEDKALQALKLHFDQIAADLDKVKTIFSEVGFTDAPHAD
ncbi:hypothetical protein HLH33_12110 [Gluconacetobacter diazotrophicus]|uniref:Uncharacterized protein n=1 Tax=Gluconacetobacter diazotrophicus TaxID=33996 RepID=A0A7W4I693_GLUDI|nr:hypothetical protein [Gluconacetobacter diazotrophicus]MBB2157045.1 hypothetical protein [Gluconacetobacter diazotrophicus]